MNTHPMHRRFSASSFALFALATVATLVPLASRASAQDGRREAQLAEDQQVLQRQLQRLRQTMDVLAARFESEGRTHAAQLLREGLKHLDERVSELGSKTVEELMSAASEALAAGQTVQSVESQEAVVKSLEKLYAILTDRAGLEDLQKSLDDLKKIRADLGKLAEREADLRKQTNAARDAAKTPEQKELTAAIDKALAEQRDLMGRTQAQSRNEGGLQLDEIQRALDKLVKQQEADAGVLSAWKPEEKAALEEAQPALDKAAESATRASRLAQAAEQLREAARTERKPTGDTAAAQRDLEHAAEREDRHQRASGDEAAKKASEALTQGAETVRKSTPDPAGRESAAKDLDAQAQALDEAAKAEAKAAQDARDAAAKALDKLGDPHSAAGQAAEAAKKALDDARKAQASPSAGADKPLDSKSLEEAQRATSEAQRANDRGAQDLKTIPPALSASQSGAAEEAKQIQGEVGALPEAKNDDAKAAQEALAAAAQEQSKAAQSAASGDAKESAQAASRALSQLQKAQAAVEKLAAKGAQSRAQSPESKALESAQKELAETAAKLGEQADEKGLSPEAQKSAQQALSGAEQAMKSAAENLQSGKPSQAAGQQSSAIEKLQKARDAVDSGSKKSAKPEDAAKQKELADEQEKIKRELLALAERNQKRSTAQPSPAMDRAQQQAGAAKEQLDTGELDEAQESEKKAEQEMRKAQEEMGKEEEQYQKLRQEELLFRIAEQVRTLLDEHRIAMKDTLEIDKQRKPGDKATHTQRLRLRKIGQSEEALAARTGEVSKAIAAEESMVFAELLDESQKDLVRLARDMGEAGDYQSGERVQVLQQDVEQSLVWLHEALSQEKERRRQEEQQQGGKPQQPAKNRLVPDVAELKLLRRMEVDVIDSLDQMRALHPELTDTKPVTGDGDVGDPLLLEDISRLAVRHKRTADLFQQFRKRLGIPDPEPTEEKK